MSKNDPLLAALTAALEEHGVCPVGASPVQTMVVAVSGGPDSICLLDALSRLLSRPRGGRRSGAPRFAGVIHVAHLHHGLRGRDADRDEAFVRSAAERYGWPVTVGHINVRERATCAKRSLQETAREARYRFLTDLAHRINASWIAVGHTATDQAETLLLRLLRGTGPAGLASIPMVREGQIIRPLLRVTRESVLDYLTRRRLAYRRDRSNRDRHYTRNRVRADLLPRLARDYNPAIVTALATTAGLIAEERQVVDELLAAIWREGLVAAAPDRLVFDRAAVTRQPAAVQRWWLRRAWRTVAGARQEAAAGSARAVQELVRRLRDGVEGRVVLRGGIDVELGRGEIRFARRAGIAAVVDSGA